MNEGDNKIRENQEIHETIWKSKKVISLFRKDAIVGKICVTINYPILKVGTGKILSVRNSVVDPYTVQNSFKYSVTLGFR